MSQGCANWRKTQIHTKRTIYVLKDGTILFPYAGPQLFAVDINGMKGPNKWGIDLFSFRTTAPTVNSRLIITPGICMTPEKGGVTTAQKLMKFINKKRGLIMSSFFLCINVSCIYRIGFNKVSSRINFIAH